MTNEDQIVALLKVVVTELTAIRRALVPPMYKVEPDGVLTRITDGAQVIPIRRPR